VLTEMTSPGCLRGECLVLADPLLFMTATGDPIASPAIDRSARIRSLDEFRAQADVARRLPQTVHDEPAIILACTWDAAFYHFLYDVLGKLAVAELHGITPADHAVYFNAVHPWQIDALRLLGVIPRPLAGGIVHRFKHGVIPTYPPSPGHETARFLRRLRNPAADHLPGRKLFVSRGANCRGRLLENETEIFDRCFQPGATNSSIRERFRSTTSGRCFRRPRTSPARTGRLFRCSAWGGSHCRSSNSTRPTTTRPVSETPPGLSAAAMRP
jgi:hypothetical protein